MSVSSVFSGIRPGGSYGRRTFVQRRLGVLKISTQLLEQLLDLPDDARIVRVVQSDTLQEGVISLVIESPLMPITIEGATLPNVTIDEARGWDS